jgi:hypothetical protein
MTIWFAHCFVPGPGYGLVCPVLSSRARACRRDHQAPSAPLPDVGVTFVRETYPVSCGDITLRSSLLRAHVPIPCGSPLLRFFTSFEESLQVATSPCCHRDLLDVILRVFPWLPGPLPRRSHRVHAPVNFPDVIGLPLGRLGRLPAFGPRCNFPWERFSRLQTFHYVQAPKFVRLPGCSHRYGYAVGRPRLLRPGRTCFVASARTGYASRPYTGN